MLRKRMLLKKKKLDPGAFLVAKCAAVLGKDIVEKKNAVEKKKVVILCHSVTIMKISGARAL